MNSTDVASKLRDFFWSDPLMGIAVAAAVVAMATTPIAFAILGRLEWFQARRGRVMMRPSFVSIICGMLLVMGIPAIFLALVIKSQYFDKDRYEFDPNQTLTVIDQGRGYRTREEMNRAIGDEMKRLADERKKLVENVKKLDESMLALRAVSGQSPAVAQTIPAVLQSLAGVRKSVGLDGPQQLMDFTAPPVDLASAPAGVAASAAPSPVTPAVAPAPSAGAGLTQAEIDAELAAVPTPQRRLAAMVPLKDLPPGWTVGKAMGPTGKARIETFNAENLFEKIDGRAESFTQYDVTGMAYTFYHPIGDESGEVQLYIFEMGNPLKALGKYNSERPEEAGAIPLGAEGYSSAGSTFFHAGPYYTQLVTNRDDPKFSDFARELAGRIAAEQQPEPAVAAPGGAPSRPAATPEALFALLPTEPKRSTPNYVAQDVFGYSFLADVFLADYEDGEVTWQGFFRPYADPDAARAVFEKYVDSARQDGAVIKMVDAEGADRMAISSNVGLVDAVFLKGNTVGGANGATDAGRAEAFARAFAKGLPDVVPAFEEKKKSAPDDTESPGEEAQD